MRMTTMVRAGISLVGILLISLSTDAESATKQKDPPTSEDFLVVDCLLPGRTRRLGRRSTYLTPRRPIRTTALDCQIRGGEYTEFDRSNYATALKVWLDEAKSGNAEAQYYVGQIYEKGLGLEPDYAVAAHWYAQAAEQGYSAAQLSLGYLYETGLGVSQDPAVALEWYRKASGLPEELIVLEGTEYQELLDLQDQLEDKIQEIDRLQSELSQLKQELEQERTDGEQKDQLENQVRRLQQQLESEQVLAETFKSRIESLEKTQSTAGMTPSAGDTQRTPPPIPTNLTFGPYNALVIGNRDYRELTPLEDAIKDAEAIASTLRDRYDFDVRTLFNASRYDILSILNELREELTEDHNLLIYYVGHSVRDRDTQRSWWQPVDAEADSRANWLSTRVMNDHLDLIPAKHILVVADAAYSGFLTRSSVPRLPQGMTQEKRVDYIQQILEKRSRLVMASGAGPSPFSDAILEVLEVNDEVVEASTVYRRVVDELRSVEGGVTPEFAPLRWARADGGGDFFFVPRRRALPAGP